MEIPELSKKWKDSTMLSFLELAERKVTLSAACVGPSDACLTSDGLVR